MGMKITLFSLVWDTAEGTDFRLFGSEAEWLNYFSKIIIADLGDVANSEANEIRTALQERDISRAYEFWQRHFKDELDTYNWDKQTIEVGTGGEVLGIISGEPPERWRTTHERA